jgi:predicted deacetylase
MTLLLSLHDVTPRHLERLQRAESLFCEIGVRHVTYLLVPRYHGRWDVERDLAFQEWCHHPRPFTVDWCLHGFYHRELQKPESHSLSDSLKRRFLTAGEGEFLALAAPDAQRLVVRGKRAFRSCLGFAPGGFVAPAWLFTNALIAVLREQGFLWTEDHRRIHDLRNSDVIPAPVITWSARSWLRRIGSIRVASVLARRWCDTPILRVAVHPLDFDHPELVSSLREVISGGLKARRANGYGEVLSIAPEGNEPR